MENIIQINSLLTRLGDRLILGDSFLKTFDGYQNEDFYAIEKIDKYRWGIYTVHRKEKRTVKIFDNEKEACEYYFINEYKSICHIKIKNCLEKNNVVLDLRSLDNLLKVLKLFNINLQYFSIDGIQKNDAINIQSYKNGEFKSSYINKDGVKKFEWGSEILNSSFFSIVFLHEFRNMEKMLLNEGFIQTVFDENILIDFL